MVRIIAGEWKGRRLNVPDGLSVRPTQDRVREALFSILYGRIEHARFLDLYAGSGVVGMEALSRGAAFVCWVESAPRSLRCLRANIVGITMTRGMVIPTTVQRYLQKGSVEPFDIVFADPPYQKGTGDSAEALLNGLAAKAILRHNGLLVFEQSGDEPLPTASGWTVSDVRVYGKTKLAFMEYCATVRAEKEEP